MERALENNAAYEMTTTVNGWYAEKFLPLWRKWGVWMGILTCLALLADPMCYYAYTRGFYEGFTQSTGKNLGQKPFVEEVLMLVFGLMTGLFALASFFLVVIFVGQVYYLAMHQPLLKNNRKAYTVLYILLLIMLWKYLSDGMFFLLEQSKDTGEKMRPGLNNEMANTLAVFAVIFLVLYGFIADFRLIRKRQRDLIQQRTEAELDALKAQVNPHFLFNSLNTIYGTALTENSPRTAESIQQLSGLVRYVMEESRLQTTDIRRELRFIDDYVELQRVRIPDRETIKIDVRIDWDEQPAQIVPLLLNPLVENAFKYGISIQHPCFVRIALSVQHGKLHLVTENSILPRTDLEKGTGLGLTNVRKRLELAYPGRHSLTVSEQSETFRVEMAIQL